MIFDTHIHSKLSVDSETEPEEAINAAKLQNIGLIFTEHYDVDYAHQPSGVFQKYFAEYLKYKGPNVLLGVEIGLTHMSTGINKRIASSYPFDYVIGSVHMVGYTDIYFDFVKSGKPAVITGGSYFDHVYKMIVENDFFDSLGHLDYPMRYSEGKEDFSVQTHKDKYDMIFKALIERGICIEINTKRIDETGAYAEMYAVYKRYRELGGRYVTLGSDAHDAQTIGKGFDAALKMASDIGLTPVYFKNRKMCGTERI